MDPASAPGKGLRRLPIMAEGKGRAGVSWQEWEQGSRGAWRDPRLLNN